jgi:shikimate kinase
MNLKKPITLIGLMGAGKTTIGIHLAKKLDIPFIDSDKVIEEQAGYAVSEIFQRDGEQFFRKVEAKTIAEILGSNQLCVLATGGGAFMNEETRAIIKEKSTSIWLNASLNILLERLEHNNTRPLLANVDKKQMLQKLMDERYPIYAQADIIVDTDVNSRTIVGSEIITKLETWQS